MRHAEANRCGIEDLGLTARGRAQAEALAAHFSHAGELQRAHRIFTSPLTRSLETAALISAQASREAERVTALCEMGELPPLGTHTEETFPAFVERVSGFLDELAEQHNGETVIAITHAGVVVASVVSIFGIPRPGTGARLEPAYCSLTEWLCENGQWTLERFNVVYGNVT